MAYAGPVSRCLTNGRELYALERVWCVVQQQERNEMAAGFDGVVVVLKLDRPSYLVLAHAFRYHQCHCEFTNGHLY